MDSIAKCVIPKEYCNMRDENGNCKLGNGSICQPIIDKCVGCDRIDNGYCQAYIYPAVKWKDGRICPLATHVQIKYVEENGVKIRAGQQKQIKIK
jgi:hypothetical protein